MELLEIKQKLKSLSTELEGYQAKVTKSEDAAAHDPAIRLLFSGFPNASELTAETLAAYKIAIADLPVAAVEDAVIMFIQDRIGWYDKDFCPLPRTLAKAARERVDHAREMLRLTELHERRYQLAYLNHDDCKLSDQSKQQKRLELDKRFDDRTEREYSEGFVSIGQSIDEPLLETDFAEAGE